MVHKRGFRGSSARFHATGTGERSVDDTVTSMTRYRFLDGMGDVVAERDFDDHAAARAWARDDDENDDEVQRVEYLGPEGDWRWAGALEG